jgi:hypothetical protein
MLEAWTNERIFSLGACRSRQFLSLIDATRERAVAMSMLRLLSQRRQYVCQQCIRRQHTLAPDVKAWAARKENTKARRATWDERAGRIKAGAEQSMLSVLEERGFVKDVAG